MSDPKYRPLSKNKEYTLFLPSDLAAHLKIHAFEREVSRAGLMRDILHFWCYRMTDPTDPYFQPERMGVKRIGLPVDRYGKERYPGYYLSLGFVDTEDNLSGDPVSRHPEDTRRIGEMTPITVAPGNPTEPTWKALSEVEDEDG